MAYAHTQVQFWLRTLFCSHTTIKAIWEKLTTQYDVTSCPICIMKNTSNIFMNLEKVKEILQRNHFVILRHIGIKNQKMSGEDFVLLTLWLIHLFLFWRTWFDQRLSSIHKKYAPGIIIIANMAKGDCFNESDHLSVTSFYSPSQRMILD